MNDMFCVLTSINPRYPIHCPVLASSSKFEPHFIMDTQTFGEMKVVKLSWLFYGHPFLRDASKSHAISGIALAIIILVFAAGGNFLIVALGVADGFFNGVALGDAIAALVKVIVLLSYNIILLNTVKKNEADEVFKIIKFGCLILLYVQLTGHLIYLVAYLDFLATSYLEMSQFDVFLIICRLEFDFLSLLIIVPALYAIHMVKPKLVNIYVYISLSLILVCVVLSGLHYASPGMFLKWISTLMWMLYCVRLLTLQCNMMIISPPSQELHQLQDIDD